MKFSQRIQANCKASIVKHIIAICAELFVLIPTASVLLWILGEMIFGGEMMGDSWFTMLLAVVILFVPLGAMDYGLFLLIRSSIRKIRTNDLESWLKTLAPYGDPQELLQAVEDLPPREVRGVDLRFDDGYLAFAKNKDIVIRRLEDVRYMYDYGVGDTMHHRMVVLLFSKGAPLFFEVDSSAQTGQVLSELYSKSGFGKWVLTGKLEHSYEPFTHSYQTTKYRLECTGEVLRFYNRKGLSEELPLTELESCYMYYVPNGDTADDYYLNLYLRGGGKRCVPIEDMREGFALYMRLLNCAPQLVYQYPRNEK